MEPYQTLPDETLEYKGQTVKQDKLHFLTTRDDEAEYGETGLILDDRSLDASYHPSAKAVAFAQSANASSEKSNE